MCHILLLLPLLLLPFLWFLPLNVGIPLLAGAVAIAVLAWWLAARAMSRPPVTGLESLPGRVARVTTSDGTSARASIDLELWDVVSDQPLEPGQSVRVRAVDGMTLRVEPVTTAAERPDQRQPAGS